MILKLCRTWAESQQRLIATVSPMKLPRWASHPQQCQRCCLDPQHGFQPTACLCQLVCRWQREHQECLQHSSCAGDSEQGQHSCTAAGRLRAEPTARSVHAWHRERAHCFLPTALPNSRLSSQHHWVRMQDCCVPAPSSERFKKNSSHSSQPSHLPNSLSATFCTERYTCLSPRRARRGCPA